MPVGNLDDSTINSEGLGKLKPRRAREPREPEELKPVVNPPPVTEEEPIRMPNPVVEEEDNLVVPETEEQAPDYRSLFSDKYIALTKKILTESDEGKALLEEIGVTSQQPTQLLPWENECLSQLRSSLSQFQGIENLEVLVSLHVNLPIQPFSLVVKP